MEHRMPVPDVPDCKHNWGGHPRPEPLVLEWIAGDRQFARYEMPYRVSDKEDGPCKIFEHVTRIEWLRIAEMALWKVYGYRVQDIFSVDWTVREVNWRDGREPRSRRLRSGNRGLQLPVNPCELLTDNIDFRI